MTLHQFIQNKSTAMLLKDISEALEELPSSKDITEAHRVF